MSTREPDPFDGPTAFVGAQIRQFREAAGLTQKQLAERINYSPSAIGMLELGERVASPEILAAADDVLDAGGMLTRLAPLVGMQRYPVSFRPWVTVEREAVELSSYDLAAIPGLLQTEEYARALFAASRPGATTEEIEELVQTRMDRKTLLSSQRPPLFHAVLAESVLWRPVGGAKVLAEQLAAVLEACESAWVNVQVVPSDVQEHAGLDGPFAIATLPDRSRVGQMDNPVGGLVTTSPDDLDWLRRVLDAIRMEALPARASVQHIATVMERWQT